MNLIFIYIIRCRFYLFIYFTSRLGVLCLTYHLNLSVNLYIDAIHEIILLNFMELYNVQKYNRLLWHNVKRQNLTIDSIWLT